MAAELDKLGFKTEWVSMSDALNRVGHLVATWQGTSGWALTVKARSGH
ncbi:hypothetical protein [Nibrella saemangeumensis]